MGERRTVQLRVAGQSYKVVSSASERELQRLAATVDAKIAEMSPGRTAPPAQALLLAAMALAHDLDVERTQRVALERKTRDLLGRALGRIDEALARRDAE